MKKLRFKRLSNFSSLIQPLMVDPESDSRAYIPNYHISLYPSKEQAKLMSSIIPLMFFSFFIQHYEATTS